MKRFVGWHIGLGEKALRLFLLNLLWVVFSLLGGIVAGVFPATAAVAGVLRRDAMDHIDERLDRSPAPREKLHREFATLWRQEFVSANFLGLIVVGLWGILLYNYQLMGINRVGLPSSVASGIIFVLLILMLIMTSNVWLLQSHFDEGAVKTLVRSAVLSVARPRHTLVLAGAVLAVASVYYAVPGLIPVFGLAAPLFLTMSYLWSTGLLVRPTIGAHA